MEFYKKAIFVAGIILIVCLAIVGTLLFFGERKNIYPPNLSKCPDYYKYNENTNNCTTTIQNLSSTCGDTFPMSGNLEDSIYPPTGKGPDSGLCKKKLKSRECGLSWDGITNDDDICFS